MLNFDFEKRFAILAYLRHSFPLVPLNDLHSIDILAHLEHGH